MTVVCTANRSRDPFGHLGIWYLDPTIKTHHCSSRNHVYQVSMHINIHYTNFSLDIHCSDLKAKLQANAILFMRANSLSHTLPSYADSYPSELWECNGNPVKTPKYIFKYMIKLLY